MGKLILVLLLTAVTSFGQNVNVRTTNDRPNPGDTFYLEYSYPTKPKDMPKTLWSYVAVIRLDGSYYQNNLYCYVYKVQPYAQGTLRIPSFAIQSDGRQVISPNIELQVGKVLAGK
jgi:hypothetical protein